MKERFGPEEAPNRCDFQCLNQLSESFQFGCTDHIHRTIKTLD